MYFDIIDYSDEELAALSIIQLKLLRTAQKAKNELEKKFYENLEEYELLLAANKMNYSNLYDEKMEELKKDYEDEVDILREQLVFNMALNEPTTDDELGGSDKGDSDETSGYPIDNSLSYLDRYILVRDYYMTIEDPDERLALYVADNTAKDYLGSYYVSLYNYLKTFTA